MKEGTMDDLEDWQPLGVEWRLHVIGKNLGRIADALEKIAGEKANPDRQITEEGYATHTEWNCYTKNGLSSADLGKVKEYDLSPPYNPVKIAYSVTTNEDYIKHIFGNACEDDE